MDKIIKERNSGKTTELIERSAKYGHYIVCCDHRESNNIQNHALRMGLKIPLPITYEEFVQKRYHGKFIDGFYIDELEMFLKYLSDIPVYAITMNP